MKFGAAAIHLFLAGVLAQSSSGGSLSGSGLTCQCLEEIQRLLQDNCKVDPKCGVKEGDFTSKDGRHWKAYCNGYTDGTLIGSALTVSSGQECVDRCTANSMCTHANWQNTQAATRICYIKQGGKAGATPVHKTSDWASIFIQ